MYTYKKNLLPYEHTRESDKDVKRDLHTSKETDIHQQKRPTNTYKRKLLPDEQTRESDKDVKRDPHTSKKSKETNTGWQRCIGCLQLQVSFRKRATNDMVLFVENDLSK